MLLVMSKNECDAVAVDFPALLSTLSKKNHPEYSTSKMESRNENEGRLRWKMAGPDDFEDEK